MKIQRKRDWQC